MPPLSQASHFFFINNIKIRLSYPLLIRCQRNIHFMKENKNYRKQGNSQKKRRKKFSYTGRSSDLDRASDRPLFLFFLFQPIGVILRFFFPIILLNCSETSHCCGCIEGCAIDIGLGVTDFDIHLFFVFTTFFAAATARMFMDCRFLRFIFFPLFFRRQNGDSLFSFYCLCPPAGGFHFLFYWHKL